MKKFKLINTTVSIRSLIKRKNDVEVATSKGDDKYPVAFCAPTKPLNPKLLDLGALVLKLP